MIGSIMVQFLKFVISILAIIGVMLKYVNANFRKNSAFLVLVQKSSLCRMVQKWFNFQVL
jgi:hypothetical protein